MLLWNCTIDSRQNALACMFVKCVVLVNAEISSQGS